ncbi:MAG: acyl-CoA synthetase [Bacteroidota bacterium]
MLELVNRAHTSLDRIAIRDPKGAYSYGELLSESGKLAHQLLQGKVSLEEARIGFMVRPGFNYVKTQWAIWRAGGVAVPICVSYPPPSIQYVLEDSQVSQIIAEVEFLDILNPLSEQTGIPILRETIQTEPSGNLPEVPASGRAMILYTSGTTGKPKGVVSTHAAIQAQISTLVKAWGWEAEDHILNILPLHHVHGILNVLSCALWSGACCEFLPKFDTEKVFEVFKKGDVNLFMAVPTIYYKLITYWDQLSLENQQEISRKLSKFRLMVSGSAALPVSTLEKWKRISGHTLLERYGMTEMGMAVSNPYKGERRPGHIGQALPGVIIRLVNEANELVEEGQSGEMQVKGPNVFREYWNKPEATQATFTKDGWFKTGDIAAFENGAYRILGRNSVDIIKSGGYKISALEIEEILRKYPGIKDCGVVGIPDDEWGEVVGAGLVAREAIDTKALSLWLKEKLPGYKLPRRFMMLQDLPRNVMGKVTKKALTAMFVNG